MRGKENSQVSDFGDRIDDGTTTCDYWRRNRFEEKKNRFCPGHIVCDTQEEMDGCSRLGTGGRSGGRQKHGSLYQ